MNIDQEIAEKFLELESVESSTEATKAKAKEIQAEANESETYAKQLRCEIRDLMAEHQITGLRVGNRKLTVARGPSAVAVLDEAQIPEEFFVITTKRELNKALLKSTLATGKAIPGAVLSEGSLVLRVQ